MMKKQQAILGCITASFSVSGALAIGIGPASIQSGLFEPLKAQVPVSGILQQDFNRVQIDIIPENHTGTLYKKASDKITGAMDVTHTGQAYITLKSNFAIKEPILTLQLKFTYQKNVVIREYNFILDPVDTGKGAPYANGAPSSTQIDKQTINQSTDTQDFSVATATRKAAARENDIRPVQALREEARVQKMPPAGHDTVTTVHLAGSFSGSYGPVKKNESLWLIAKKLHNNLGLSIEQTMGLIFNNNRRAFINDSPDLLKAGETLVIISADRMTAQHDTLQTDVSKSNNVLPLPAQKENNTAARIKTTTTNVGPAIVGTQNVDLPAPLMENTRKNTVIGTTDGETVRSLSDRLKALAVRDSITLVENKKLSQKIAQTEQVLTELEAVIKRKDKHIEQIAKYLEHAKAVNQAKKDASKISDKSNSLLKEVFIVLFLIALALVAGINAYTRAQLKRKQSAKPARRAVDTQKLEAQYSKIRTHISATEAMLVKARKKLEQHKQSSTEHEINGLYQKLFATLEDINQYRSKHNNQSREELDRAIEPVVEDALKDAFEALGANNKRPTKKGGKKMAS